MHKQMHVCTNTQTNKHTNARLHVLMVCCRQDLTEKMSHTSLLLLSPCFDVANLKIKTHISKHKRMFVYMFMRLFVHSFIRLFVCSFVYVCVQTHVCSFICLFVYLFVCLFMCTCIY